MFEDIYDLSLNGEINREDALKLVNSNHFELFNTADQLRQEIVGDEVTFVANRNIDITDHCIIGCTFCSFRDNIGYEMTTEEILESVKETSTTGKFRRAPWMPTLAFHLLTVPEIDELV